MPTVTPAPISCTTVFDSLGRPVIGANVYCYMAGTTTPATCYSDPAGTVALPQPFLVSGAGRIPAVYLPAGNFRFRICGAGYAQLPGPIIEDIDQVSGFIASTVNQTVTQIVSETPVAALQPYYGNGRPDGWVRANGRTLGNAVSGATELADVSAQALYVALWNADPNLAVGGGRGPAAQVDFAGGKTIALPDLRRRALVGIDGMGNGALGGASTYALSTLGAEFGEETHLLVTAEMPSHTHGATTDTQGTHTHAATMDTQGDHTHAATVDQQGVHIHSGTTDIQGEHIHNLTYASYATDGGPVTTGVGVRNTYVQQAEQTDAAGVHGHNVNLASAGAHIHNVTVPNAGAHIHNITVPNAGAHIHNVTVASVGGDGAHNNIAPSMPVTILIKL